MYNSTPKWETTERHQGIVLIFSVVKKASVSLQKTPSKMQGESTTSGNKKPPHQHLPQGGHCRKQQPQHLSILSQSCKYFIFL